MQQTTKTEPFRRENSRRDGENRGRGVEDPLRGEGWQAGKGPGAGDRYPLAGSSAGIHPKSEL